MKNIPKSIINYLQTPRSFEEIQERFAELGSAWSAEQIALFLELLPGIVRRQGHWQMEGSGKKQAVLEAVEQALSDRPLVPIQRILKSPLLADIETTAEESLQIAVENGRYASPNSKVIKRL